MVSLFILTPIISLVLIYDDIKVGTPFNSSAEKAQLFNNEIINEKTKVE